MVSVRKNRRTVAAARTGNGKPARQWSNSRLRARYPPLSAARSAKQRLCPPRALGLWAASLTRPASRPKVSRLATGSPPLTVPEEWGGQETRPTTRLCLSRAEFDCSTYSCRRPRLSPCLPILLDRNYRDDRLMRISGAWCKYVANVGRRTNSVLSSAAQRQGIKRR